MASTGFTRRCVRRRRPPSSRSTIRRASTSMSSGASVHLTKQQVEVLMNTRIFAYPNANVRNLRVEADGQNLIIHGTLSKGATIPFTMARHTVDSRGTVAGDRDQRGEDRRGRRDRPAQRASHQPLGDDQRPGERQPARREEHDPDRRVLEPAAAAPSRRDRVARLLRERHRPGDRLAQRGRAIRRCGHSCRPRWRRRTSSLFGAASSSSASSPWWIPTSTWWTPTPAIRSTSTWVDISASSPRVTRTRRFSTGGAFGCRTSTSSPPSSARWIPRRAESGTNRPLRLPDVGAPCQNS